MISTVGVLLSWESQNTQQLSIVTPSCRRANWHYEPPDVGISTVFHLPHQEDPTGLDIALVGLPYDGGSTGRTGTRGGPRAVRDQSFLTGSYEHQTQIIPAMICRCADIGDGIIHTDKKGDSRR
jgi:arginase family enzyme